MELISAAVDVHGRVAGDDATRGREDQHTAVPRFSVGRFAIIVYGLGVLGWLLESVITGAALAFVYKVRPDLIGIAFADHKAARPLIKGDESL